MNNEILNKHGEKLNMELVFSFAFIIKQEFTASIYSEDLAGYDIQQVEGQSNQFYIRRKYIAF